MYAYAKFRKSIMDKYVQYINTHIKERSSVCVQKHGLHFTVLEQ